ncbi:hypothetical protein D3C76_1253820 [compost metagenome]
MLGFVVSALIGCVFGLVCSTFPVSALAAVFFLPVEPGLVPTPPSPVLSFDGAPPFVGIFTISPTLSTFGSLN